MMQKKIRQHPSGPGASRLVFGRLPASSIKWTMVLFPTEGKRMAEVYQQVRLNLSDGHVLRSAINRYFVAQDSGTRHWGRK